ncbi:MAG TPA: ABC transporter substrate-binding protein, partial [Cryptosporangiaceae bacterium]|nr:ABC transporter substrate-binding protein [Cryptosporangiaceae bacterium]
FPNLTHATPIVGLANGTYTKALGGTARLSTQTFNAGPSVVEALFAGAIDAAYIGPSPAVNAYVKSNGEAVRVVAGSASGGVALVVQPGIDSAEDLRGKKIGTPQLGNTQDVAARYWLKEKGLKTTREGGGDVRIVPQENAQSLDTFSSGEIDGAWVPEPWVSRLVDAGGTVLVDERDLWPARKFVITHLLVRTEFLQEHPDVVKRLIQGHVDANALIETEPEKAQRAVSVGIGKLTGKPLELAIIEKAWPTLTFLNDPIASSLVTGAEHAEELGLLEPADDLAGLYDLKLLNQVLAARGDPTVPRP